MTFKSRPLFYAELGRNQIGTDDYFLEDRIMVFTTRILGMQSQVPAYHLPYHIFMLDTIPMTTSEYSIFCDISKRMSDMYNVIVLIIKSSKRESGFSSYHVVMPHTFSPSDIRRITLEEYTSEADMLFFGLGWKRMFWDLRITSKGKGTGDSPSLIEAIIPRTTSGIRPISEVHWALLTRYLTGLPTNLNRRRYPMFHNLSHLNEILIRYSVSP